MEYRVDLAGNVPEQAQAGAAALRDEGAAAKGATEGLRGFKASAAALEATTKAVHGLTDALREMHAAQTKAAPAFSNARDEDFGRSKWETPPTKSAKPAEITKAAEGAHRAQKATKGAGSALSGVFDGAAGAIGKAVTGVGLYVAAMAGLHSLGDLTRMAVGWRTLGQLQLISWRATMDLRRAVAGVDAQPLVRAAERFEKNLSQSTVTGKALSGILTRGFNAVFSAGEKLEPLFERAFQKAVLGALQAEGAWLDLRIAAFPLTSAVEELWKQFDNSPLSAITNDAFNASTGFAQIADAIGLATKALQGWQNIIAAASGKGNSLTNVKENVGLLSHEEAEKRRNEEAASRGMYRVASGQTGQMVEVPMADPNWNAAPQSADAASAGRATGKALGDGMVQGMGDSGAAVEAAGRALSGCAVAGARAEAGAHSPADKTIALGHDLSEGAVVGMRQGAGAVQAEAERSLVPSVGASKGGGAGAGAGGGLALTVQGPLAQIVLQGGGANVDDLVAQLMARAPDVMQEALRVALARLGLGLVGATAT